MHVSGVYYSFSTTSIYAPAHLLHDYVKSYLRVRCCRFYKTISVSVYTMNSSDKLHINWNFTTANSTRAKGALDLSAQLAFRPRFIISILCILISFRDAAAKYRSKPTCGCCIFSNWILLSRGWSVVLAGRAEAHLVWTQCAWCRLPGTDGAQWGVPPLPSPAVYSLNHLCSSCFFFMVHTIISHLSTPLY